MMKKYALLILLLGVAVSAHAFEESDRHILKYLSDVERPIYFKKKFKNMSEHAIRHGELDRDGLITQSIEMEITALPDEDSPSPQAPVVVGYLRCDIRADDPHKTRFGAYPVVVKSKSKGKCSISPTGYGVLPTVTWNLFQLQTSGAFSTVWATHKRTGRNPVWSDSSAFVIQPGCKSGTYYHTDYVVITVPFGYLINNISPIWWMRTGSSAASVSC